MDIPEKEYKALMARVKAGAAVLDKDWQGWRSGIDLERLDITSIGNCVLGQLYGDYGTGWRTLEKQAGYELECRDLGFSWWWNEEDPDLLTAVWRDYLEAS
jgi:hypothetical protein